MSESIRGGKLSPREKLAMIQKAVNMQAKDDALWFIDVGCGEHYLQQALRDLHKVIEVGDEAAFARIKDCMECSSGEGG